MDHGTITQIIGFLTILSGGALAAHKLKKESESSAAALKAQLDFAVRVMEINKNELKGDVAKASSEIAETRDNLHKVGKEINGRMTELVAVTKQVGFQEGVDKEKKDVQEKKDDRAQKKRNQ